MVTVVAWGVVFHMTDHATTLTARPSGEEGEHKRQFLLPGREYGKAKS